VPPLTRHARAIFCCIQVKASAAASFQCPYTTLGVEPDADESQVKRAYRKQALKWHPDVSKEVEPTAVFLQLSEAYSFIMGKLGKGPDGSGAGGSTQTDDWEFHDWYWSFRMSRTWNKNQDGTAAAPPEPKPAGRPKLNEQLAGLRHRAAVRANAPPKASPAASAASCDGEPAAASTAGRPAEPASNEAASESEDWDERDWMDGHVYLNVGDSVGYEVPDASWAYSQTRRKFVAHQGTREQVTGQLAGLRRKARASRQHASTGYV
jgi:hypothetical protein